MSSTQFERRVYNKSINTMKSNIIKRNGNHKRFDFSTNQNLRSFKTVAALFSTLKKRNLIDEKQFEELIAYSCSIFVENLIEEKITKTFANSLLTKSNKILENI